MKDTIRFVPYEYDNYVFLAALYNLGAQIYGIRRLTKKAIDISREGVRSSRSVRRSGFSSRPRLLRVATAPGRSRSSSTP